MSGIIETPDQWTAHYTPSVAEWHAAFDTLTGDVSGAPVLALGTTTPQTLAKRFGACAYVQDFITPAMVAANDYSAAFQAAAATGKPVILPPYACRITQPIVCVTHGQQFIGYGRTVSLFQVDASFSMGSQGVFIATLGEPGPEFIDFGIQFAQPDTASFSALTAYPPAFFLGATPRCRLTNIRIIAGYGGILMAGNSGGTNIRGLETSCLSYNIQIDGCEDSVRIDDWHCFPTGLTANQTAIFNSANCYGLKSGRCDDLHVTDCLWLCGFNTATYFFASAGYGGDASLAGNTFGTLTDCDWDTNGGLNVTSGTIAVLGGSMTLGDGQSQCFLVTNGKVRILGTYMTQAVANGVVSMATISGGTVSIAATEWTWAPDTQCITITNGQLNLTGNQFNDASGAGGRTNAKIEIQGGDGSITGNSFLGYVGGTRTGISMVGDFGYEISGNSMNGNGIALTQNPILATFANNSGCLLDIAGNTVVGVIRSIVVETYALNSSGALVAPHSLNLAYQKVLSCIGWYKGASGSAYPLVLVAVDGTNVNFSGGPATAGTPARFYLEYINQQQGW